MKAIYKGAGLLALHFRNCNVVSWGIGINEQQLLPEKSTFLYSNLKYYLTDRLNTGLMQELRSVKMK